MPLIHQHMIIRALVKKPMKSQKMGRDFLNQLVEIIGMKVVIPARAAYVKDPENRGLTGSVNLATSHAAFHIWDVPVASDQVSWGPKKGQTLALVQMDVYSCHCFDPKLVLEHINKFMGLVEARWSIFDREDLSIYSHHTKV